jgi:hypothetical protein
MLLAGVLQCQDVSLSGVLGRTVANGVGANLCITAPGYLRCQNISQEDATSLIRQHNCAGARNGKKEAQSEATFAEKQADASRLWAAKMPEEADFFKTDEAGHREEAETQRSLAAGYDKNVKKWCPEGSASGAPASPTK